MRTSDLFQIYQTAPNSGWGSPELLGSNLGGFQICVATNSDNRMEAFLIDENYNVQHVWQTKAGSAAGSFSSVAAFPFQAKQIAVGRNADGRLELFYVDMSDNINHCYETVPGGGPWTGSIAFGGQARQLALTNDSLGRLQLFYVGMNNLIYTNWQTAPSTNTWDWTYINMPVTKLTVARDSTGCLQLVVTALPTPQQPLIGAGVYSFKQAAPASKQWSPSIGLGTFAKDITFATHTDGSLELYGIATNDSIFSIAQNNNVWQHVVYLGGMAQQLCLCRDVDGRFDFFYVGMDGYAYHLWQTQVKGPFAGGGGRAGFLASYLANTTDSNGQIVVFALGYTSAPADAVSLTAASNNNYLFYNNGRPLYSVKTTLTLTSELDTGSSTQPPNSGPFQNGFSLQLNGYSPMDANIVWQQYILDFDGTSFYGWTNLWTQANLPVNTPVINTKMAKFATLSTGKDSSGFQKVPSGYQLEIQLNTDSLGNVLGAQFTAVDDKGKQLGTTYVNTSQQSGYTAGDCVPIVAFELNLVGAMDLEDVTFNAGAGTFTYQSPAVMTPLAAIPSCAAIYPARVKNTVWKTGELSNASYGSLNDTPQIATSQSVTTVTSSVKMKALREKMADPRIRLVSNHPPA